MVDSHEKKTGKKSQKGRPAPDKRPARARYWASGRLAVNKIRNLMRSGYSFRDALSLWEATRTRHRDKINSSYLFAIKVLDR